MAPFPAGHFYSPVVNVAELRRREQQLWSEALPETPGVDYRAGAQAALLDAMAAFAADFRFPEEEQQAGASQYFEQNGQFAGLDSRMWHCLLRHWQPKRVIEVGSGFSSLIAADANHRFLKGRVRITCIEPHPRSFLRGRVPGLNELLERPVQEIPLERFLELERGDVLFIDSSHVSKTGSDVNYLYLQVLPRLRPGVIVHVHDVFLPREYPRGWVLDEERSWNEQYLLQALLVDSVGFEVVFGCAYAIYCFPERIEQVFGAIHGGGSFWMRRCAEGSDADP